MYRFAERVSGVSVSGIRRMFELARRMKNPYDFSLGLPDFDVPEAIKAAMRNAIDDGHNRYTPTQGIDSLRDEVTRTLKQTYGIEAGRENVLITSGSTGALYAGMMALVDAGDEVLIPDPYFVLYPLHVRFTRGRPVFIDTYATGFKLTPGLLERHITPRTKVLIFNNPCNPTGVAYTADEVKGIAGVCRRHGIVVLSDEVYDRFCFDFRHESLALHHPHTVLIGALSKTHAMTGWRIGYAVGPEPIIERMTVVQQFTYVCAPSVGQVAAIEALRRGPDARVLEAYRRKRDLVVEMLEGAFELVKPQGAFYAFPKAPGGDADAFVRRALEREVIVVPGKTASAKNTHFRISFAVPDETLRGGLRILRELAGG